MLKKQDERNQYEGDTDEGLWYGVDIVVEHIVEIERTDTPKGHGSAVRGLLDVSFELVKSEVI